MTASIVTVTLNPALDCGCTVENVVPERKLRCESLLFQPGGGGLNVARVLTRFGAKVEAMWSAGGPTGSILAELLLSERVTHRPVPIREATRQNMTVCEAASGQQYRFVLPGPGLTLEEQSVWLSSVEGLSPAPDYLVLSGSLPPFVSPDFYAQLARRAPRASRVVLDTSGEALRASLEAGVFLLKPNLRELSHLVGQDFLGDDDIERAARSLVRRGAAQLVAVSLGRSGAMLVSETECVRINAPTVRVASTVGAGDSMVAGLVYGLMSQLPLAQVLALGVAAGSAATMRAGTGLCRREDVEALRRRIAIPGPPSTTSAESEGAQTLATRLQ